MSRDATSMRIEVSTETCIGAGNCVDIAAEVFDQSIDTGKVVLLVEEPSGTLADLARKAAAICPTGAITIVEP